MASGLQRGSGHSPGSRPRAPVSAFLSEHLLRLLPEPSLAGSPFSNFRAPCRSVAIAAGPVICRPKSCRLIVIFPPNIAQLSAGFPQTLLSQTQQDSGGTMPRD